MSFGDLITLLLFILFIVVPAFNRNRRTTPPREARRVEPPRTSVDPERAPEPSIEDDLLRRLEAARERVRRAMESEGAGPTAPTLARGEATRPTAGAASPANPPAARPLVTAPPRPLVTAPPRPLVTAAPRPLVTPTARTAPGPASDTGTREGATTPRGRDLQRDATALAPERATAAHAGWRFDPRGAREGFIWHQILGRPRARERLGGTPYRHP